MTKMINVVDKPDSKRMAKATAFVKLHSEILKKIQENKMPKGNVLETAKIAGILAGKQTSNLIPLCHNIPIHSIQIEFIFQSDGIRIFSTVNATAKTGVEMEALVASSHAALTIYDMSKMFSKEITITDIELLEKRGGKSGDFFKVE